MEEIAKKENLLESGTYVFKAPENGDISMDILELQSDIGAKRIWRVKSLSKEEIEKIKKDIKFIFYDDGSDPEKA